MIPPPWAGEQRAAIVPACSGAADGRHAPDADTLSTLAATLEGHQDNVALPVGGVTLSWPLVWARRRSCAGSASRGLDPGPLHRLDNQPHATDA